MKFWVLWGIDLLVAFGFLYFFFVGLTDGSVSSFNIVLWLIILGSLAAVLGGGWLLRARGRNVLALVVLALLAVPAVGALLFFLFIVVSNPRWN